MTALDSDIREGVDRETVETVKAMGGAYKYGWETDIEMEFAPKGLNEDIVRLISEKITSPNGCLIGVCRRSNAGSRWLNLIGRC